LIQNSKQYLIPQKITSKLGIPQVINVVEELPVNPKYSWAQLEVMKGNPRTIEDITTIVLHHCAISKASVAGRSDMNLMTSIANTHIRSTKNRADGDGGFPYDFYIRNGNIYQTNDIRPLKFGVASNNSYTLHICVSGDYATTDVLTDPDRKALVGLVVALKGDLPSYKAIKAHKEIMPTSCPGYDYAKIRNDVKTTEMNLDYDQSDDAYQARAFTVATRILDLYNKSKDPNNKFKSEAQRKLLLLEEKCKELELI